MKATEFCYWLQGVFEVSELANLNEKQTAMVKAHLALVFQHDIDPAQVADSLQRIHDNGKTSQPRVAQDHIHPGDVLLRC
jgi:hypothetical protein